MPFLAPNQQLQNIFYTLTILILLHIQQFYITNVERELTNTHCLAVIIEVMIMCVHCINGANRLQSAVCCVQ